MMDEVWITLPAYSSVRIHEDEDDPFVEEMKPKPHRNDRLHEFKRRNTIGILLLFAWAASMMLGCCVTGTIVRHNTWLEADEQLKVWKEDYKKELADAADSDAFLSDAKSRQEAIDRYTALLKVHAGSLRMERGVTPEGVETYLWVDMTRYLSGLYGKELWDVLISDQIECFIMGHSSGPEDEEIAERVSTMVVDNQRPKRYRNDLFYAEINADGSVTARNELHTSSRTKFWSIEY